MWTQSINQYEYDLGLKLQIPVGWYCFVVWIWIDDCGAKTDRHGETQSRCKQNVQGGSEKRDLILTLPEAALIPPVPALVHGQLLTQVNLVLRHLGVVHRLSLCTQIKQADRMGSSFWQTQHSVPTFLLIRLKKRVPILACWVKRLHVLK